jgi:hypothetical protein
MTLSTWTPFLMHNNNQSTDNQHDTQHKSNQCNENQHNDTQHKSNQCNDNQYNNNQHDNNQYSDDQRSDNQHIDNHLRTIRIKTISIMILNMAATLDTRYY